VFLAGAVCVALFYAGRRLHRAALRPTAVHAAIAARADYEHAAIMPGDVGLGTFGQFQLAPR
jgi:hypothetical protein